MDSISKMTSQVLPFKLLLQNLSKALAAAVLLLTVWPSQGSAAAGDIFIVDTVEREATRQFGEALSAICTTCGQVKYRQMNGNMRAARRIAEELSREEQNGNVSLVVTLGKPATRVLADKLKNTTILYTFVGQEIPEYRGSKRVIGLPTDAPVLTQVNLLAKLLPTAKSAGILLGEGGGKISESEFATSDIAVNVYRINDRNDLPTTLRMAVQKNDALILLRDRMIVNNDTIQFVLQQTLENGRHTIAYSQSLVDMGFAAALVPRPEAFGRLVGQAVATFLDGGGLVFATATEDDYLVHLNPTVLDRLNRLKHAPETASVGLGQ